MKTIFLLLALFLGVGLLARKDNKLVRALLIVSIFSLVLYSTFF